MSNTPLQERRERLFNEIDAEPQTAEQRKTVTGEARNAKNMQVLLEIGKKLLQFREINRNKINETPDGELMT